VKEKLGSEAKSRTGYLTRRVQTEEREERKKRKETIRDNDY
jgi:hypothetical protein